VRTTVRPETRRDEVYGLMRAAVAAGRQVYVVSPIIEES
jgi:RecG-like helicase